MKIAFIGVGSMGKAIIPNLVKAGHEVSAWNRNANAVAELDNVAPLKFPAQAFSQDVVITMLSDDIAVRSTLVESNALTHASTGCIHIIMSTLSPLLIEELEQLHDECGIDLIAAPVFGIPTVAAKGELNILAAGRQIAIDRVQPVFDVMGKKTWRLGSKPVRACIAKIAGNMMITHAIEALGEASRLTESYGLPAEDFIEVVTQTMFACPSYQRYGQNIANNTYEPGFKLLLGLKDVNLAVDAAHRKSHELPATNVVRTAMVAAVAEGLGDKDWSIIARTAPQAAKSETTSGTPEGECGNQESLGKSANVDEQPSLPFWSRGSIKTSRRGSFWVIGERVSKNGKTFQRGPMYVSWEAPVQVTQPYPIVLVHGGTLQSTEWQDTPDGRPGWAQRFVESGYVVFSVDRPGHGRSPYHSEIMGPMGPAFSYERAREVYFPEGGTESQWPFSADDDGAFDSFIAAYGPMPADLAASQSMDADRLARLLDRIGKAIVVTHSASGPDGWLVADRRPGLVAAIVAVEPMGPAFGNTPGIGSLDWGLTAAPMTFSPPRTSAAQVKAAAPATLVVPALEGLPVALLTGETSIFATYSGSILQFLRTAGAQADHLDLPALGIHGNGHGLIYELNSDDAFNVVSDWLQLKIHEEYTL